MTLGMSRGETSSWSTAGQKGTRTDCQSSQSTWWRGKGRCDRHGRHTGDVCSHAGDQDHPDRFWERRCRRVKGIVASLAKPGGNVTGLTFQVDALKL